MDRGSLFGFLARRPVMAAVLGAMSIAFSGILVRLANVEPSTAAIQLLGAGTILVGLLLATLRFGGEPRRVPVAEPEIG